jgi:hypothetical protein
MPLTEGDVLDTLSDPVALGIEFYADKIHVKGEYLTTVRDHIRAGNILVKGGTEDLAWDASCRHREEAEGRRGDPGVSGRPTVPGSPRRFAPRDDGSRVQRLIKIRPKRIAPLDQCELVLSAP